MAVQATTSKPAKLAGTQQTQDLAAAKKDLGELLDASKTILRISQGKTTSQAEKDHAVATLVDTKAKVDSKAKDGSGTTNVYVIIQEALMALFQSTMNSAQVEQNIIANKTADMEAVSAQLNKYINGDIKGPEAQAGIQQNQNEVAMIQQNIDQANTVLQSQIYASQNLLKMNGTVVTTENDTLGFVGRNFAGS